MGASGPASTGKDLTLDHPIALLTVLWLVPYPLVALALRLISSYGLLVLIPYLLLLDLITHTIIRLLR